MCSLDDISVFADTPISKGTGYIYVPQALIESYQAHEMLTILASYAQEESRSASENQKWRVRKGFEKGELLNGRIVLGYDIGKDGITVNPEEAELLHEIFRRFIDGESMR